MRLVIEYFLYFQILDALTTMIGFSLGTSEANPVVAMMLRFGPAAGLMFVKMLAVGFAILCLALNRHRLIVWFNYFFMGLILWNLSIILRVLHS